MTPQRIIFKNLQSLKALAVLLLSVFTLLSNSALADEENKNNWLPEQFQLHAFGTIGASYHNEKGLGYRRNLEQKNTVQGNHLDFSSDSLLGGQADLLINDTFSSSLQVVSRNNSSDNWKPEVISAFIKYKPSEALQFRIGRMPTTSNIGAETRYVSYAYTQVRPSPEVYGLFSLYDRYDGVDAEYTFPFASGIGKVIINYGKDVGEFYLDGKSSDVSDVSNYGLVTLWQKNNLELLGLFSVHHTKDQDSFEPLAASLDATPFPLANQRANEIRSAEDYKTYIFGASVSYELEAWKFQGVMTRSNTDNYFEVKGKSGSAIIAYRLGKFTPYAITGYSRLTTKFKPIDIPNIPNPQLQALNAAYNYTSTLFERDISSTSLGLRYDIAENYAVKLQVDKINAKLDPVIISTKPQGTNKDITLFTIALDFLF
jgi:hypothetical protein